MKKKWLCGVLALVMLLTAFSGVKLPIRAAGALTASEELIAVIKRMEGFTKYPTWDYLQYSIGYGCAVPNDKFEYYSVYGITEAEADALLREYIKTHEEILYWFMDRYNIPLTQSQFDALLSYNLNCGASWVYDPAGTLHTALRTGAPDYMIIYAFVLTSIAGGDYILQRRRLAEANMFLNGVYEACNDHTDGSYPDTYRYVFLDGNGGEINYAIHGYDGALKSPIITYFREIPTGVDEEGNAFIYEFAGWYTEPTGGEKIEILDATLPTGKVLYAHWMDPDGNVVELPKGDVLEPLEVTLGSEVKVREGPGTFYNRLDIKSAGTKLVITQTYYYRGTLWGKCEDGWFSLTYTDYEQVLADREAAKEESWPKSGVITDDFVNIRTGPGTSYESAGYQLNAGAQVVILKTEYDGTQYTWGQLEDGNWVCMTYVQLEGEKTEDPILSNVTLHRAPTRTDYVQMQDYVDFMGMILRLEYSDGTIGAAMPDYYATTTYSNAKLGETTVTVLYKGFTVSFTVNIIKATVTFLNEDGTVLSTGQYEYGETIPVPEVPPKEADETGEYVFAGWDKEVTTCDGDATYTAVFKSLSEETDPTDPDDTVPDDTVPDDTVPDETLPGDDDTQWPKTGIVVTDGTPLSIRTGPGVNYDWVGYLVNGSEVTIHAMEYDGTTYWWGKIAENQWICMSYVQLDEPIDDPQDPTEPPTEPEDPTEPPTAPEDPTVPPTEPEKPTEPEYTPGDFDGNDTVDEDDAIYLLRYVFFPDDYPVAIPADYDGNGTVDEDDAIYLLRHIFFPEDYPLT